MALNLPPDGSPIGPDFSNQQQGQPVQSLLQMAMGSTNQFAPSWVKDQLGAYIRDNPGSNIGFGGTGNLVPELNPDNWGPPPPVGGASSVGGEGWFPAFTGVGSDPNEKYWTMASYANQLPGGPGGLANDQSPNTRNWRLMQGVAPGQNTLPGGGAAEPGDFMYLGHPISLGKMREDFLRNANPAAGGEGTGTPGGILHHSTGFGPAGTAWSTAGQVGLPGQLDPWATMWGVGGPGG